jgi:predicted Zn-dependent protease
VRWSTFVLVLAVLPASAQQQTGADPNLYSRQREAALGAELARQVERTSTPVNDPEALRYVEQVGERLAAQLPEPRFSYTFALIVEGNSVSREPVALPGGYIFVPKSVLLAARDEAEFAGVLAHAMAHAADRDATRLATRGQMTKTTQIPLIFYGGLPNPKTSGVAIPVAFLQISKAYERDADALAVKIASGAGYDAQGLLRYLNHELPGDPRIEALRNALQAPPLNSNDEFLRIQNQIRNSPQN